MGEIEVAGLYSQQAAAYRKMVRERGGVVWMRVGTGKTRVGLMSAIALSKCRAIVAVCRREAFTDWTNEVATLQLPHSIIEAEDLIPNITFIEFTLILLSEGLLLNRNVTGVLDRLKENGQVGAYIIDEAYLFKNPRSQKHIELMRLRHPLPTIVMSGSIMPARDLVDIYGQVELSGHGKRLAKHLTSFREKFQTGIKGHFFAWYPKQGAFKSIMEKIEPFTYIYMPKHSERRIEQTILKVDPSPQQLEWFKELKETAAIDGKFELTNMATVAIKAQQISDGWLKLEGADAYEHFPSPKVNRTIALVQEIVESGEKVVVWCAFRYDRERLADLEQIGPVATLQSGGTFDRVGWEKGKYRICIATTASGNSINAFEHVPYGIYFSQDVKWLSQQQSMGRHDRRSSTHDTCYFTFIHTNRSLDSAIYYTVRNSQSMEGSIISQLDVLQWLRGND
jgi:hypothetical protein